MKHLMRATATVLLICMIILMPMNSTALAKGDNNELQDEASRINFELLQLRGRRQAATNEGDLLRSELQGLDARIAAAQASVGELQNDIKSFQDSYASSMRTLYEMGSMTELEILLGAKELDEAWQDHAVYERLMALDGDKMEELKTKLADIEDKKRDLGEDRYKQARIEETLDTVALDTQISQLEARLSVVNNTLRSEAIMAGGSGGGQGKQPQSGGGKTPTPGRLEDRIPDPPSLDDFEPTGIVISGYTTCYGEEFEGRPTASGAVFHMYDYTCAHKTLPFGTWLLVKFRGRQVIVQVNDRGPFVAGRVLDLSFGAAQSIGLDGVQWTDFEILAPKGN